MTMTPIELPAVAALTSPVARLLQRVALWQEVRHRKKAERAARAGLAEMSEHLRRYVGLDGGASLRPPRRNGRSFDHNQHPDAVVRQWGL